MCEYSERLIAWMDGELAESEAAELEQHVRACAACRECVSAYEAASRDFASYYAVSTQAAVAPAPRRSVPLWMPGAAIAAVAAMLAIGFLAQSVKQAPVAAQIATAPAPSGAGIARPTVGSVTKNPISSAKPELTQGLKPSVHLAHVGTARGRALIRGVSGTGSRSADTDWAMAEPAIQIAIPADAMFPPGAVPEGVTYIANVSLGADGSIQGIRLQP
jgi:anti-sigma factor RsiW